MTRDNTLRLVDLAARNAEVLAVMVAEVPADGLSEEEARRLDEVGMRISLAAASLKAISEAVGPNAPVTPSSAEKDPAGGWWVPVGYSRRPWRRFWGK
jgi:hypothetical protein